MPGTAVAQEVDTDLWGTDGPVYAVARSGGTVYVGGAFGRVGPATGGGAPVDSSSGALPADFPRVDGIVVAAAADGAGGWYVGGYFTSVGGLARANLAHIASDLSVTPWNPGTNSVVATLAVSNGIVYAGGFFTSAGGQPRNRAAAFDAMTGALTAWSPDADNWVHALAVRGGVVYAGGEFNTIGGAARSRLAAIDTTTGAALAWNPGCSDDVWAVAVRGGIVYAGGEFDSIGGTARHKAAALDAVTGAATAWNPDPDSRVHAITVDGGTIYAAGYFTSIGGQSRAFVAALDTLTGAASGWDAGADAIVQSITVSGDKVYVGGAFETIGGKVRGHAAVLEKGTAAATPWNPDADALVYAVVPSGTRVYVGGEFTSLGGQVRNACAAFDAASGAATAWAPQANGAVRALALRGTTVYLGGDFTMVGGLPRAHLAAVDAVTGAVTGWNPGASASVEAIAVRETTVFVAGAFDSIGGEIRHHIAAIDAGTGAASAWNPDADLPVHALAVRGGTIYAGGDFGMIGGQARDRIAALDVAAGNATAWNPGADAPVLALAAADARVYAVGFFGIIGGQSRTGIAALDTLSGSAAGWNPAPDTMVVSTLAVDGPTVYAGGLFSAIGGQSRRGVAAIEAASGNAAGWNADASGPAVGVTALALGGGYVYLGGQFTSVRGRLRNNLAAVRASPSLLGVLPAAGGNAGVVTVTVEGNQLPPGSAVWLARTGEADVPGSGVVVAPDGVSLTASFDLAARALGAWDVVVATPDSQVASLADGFTIEASAPYQIRVGVLGPALMLVERSRAFDVVLENQGNSDIMNQPLWLTGIPAGATVETDFPVTAPPQDGGEPDWSTVPSLFPGTTGQVMVLVIPRVPPGSTVRRVHISVPVGVTAFDLTASVTPPWTDGLAFRHCLVDAGVITAPSCVATQLGAIDAFLAGSPAIQALNGIGLWAKVAWQCEGAPGPGAALAIAEAVLGVMAQPVEGSGVSAGCEVPLVPRWQERRTVTIVEAVDPNEKIGPIGYGQGQEIGSGQLLPYSVRFENLDIASAPAQTVVVLDQIDPVAFDLNTVTLGPITFGDHLVLPPAGLNSYTTEVDLRPEQDVIVRVSATYSPLSGTLSWALVAIDPETGQVPLDPLTGFLPPNVTPPEGEGSVLFTVMPNPGLGGGEALSNSATIAFNGRTPIETAAWSNLLDGTAPESQVLPLASDQDSATFTVSWEVSGSPPDFRDFSVYVSENGGDFRPWRVHTTATADTFAGNGGRSYAFYSLARDLSGNLEQPPPVPDAETTTPVGVGGPGAALRFALAGAIPNPVVGEARVGFTLPDRTPASLEVLDVSGRRVWRRDVGALGPGRYVVDVGARRPGLYFVRLRRGGETLRARMVVLR